MPKARHRKFREPCRRVGWISEWRLQAIPAADILPESSLERPLRSKRHLPRCFLHQMLITLVVAPGRHDGGMSHRLPHGVDVGAGLKEPRRKGSAKIMRREGRNLRFVRPGAQQLMDGAGRNRPVWLDVVALLRKHPIGWLADKKGRKKRLSREGEPKTNPMRMGCR